MSVLVAKPGLLMSRTFWELVVLAVLAIALVASRHQIDRYRGLVAQEAVNAQLSALNQDAWQHRQAAATAREEAEQAGRSVQTFAKLLEQVQQARPKPQEVAHRVQAAAITDEGLVSEAQRVLGVPVRLSGHCD